LKYERLNINTGGNKTGAEVSKVPKPWLRYDDIYSFSPLQGANGMFGTGRTHGRQS
jgi:hypothetical protein